VLHDLRAIEHIEIIRIGSRMPVVLPMRIDTETAVLLRKHKPVYVMAHFNHPRELTEEAATALENLVDHGVPVFNQKVLLNGINNHAAIVQALSRRLLFLRVKPYYVFQCDPSPGSEHFRTGVAESLEIQRELWGRLSGLAMPNLSLDIPGGGGKTGLVPDFEIKREDGSRTYRGWDGIEAEYRDPDPRLRREPADAADYLVEWEEIKTQSYGKT
jgi:lysine 2,3-aminomutase